MSTRLIENKLDRKKKKLRRYAEYIFNENKRWRCWKKTMISFRYSSSCSMQQRMRMTLLCILCWNMRRRRKQVSAFRIVNCLHTAFLYACMWVHAHALTLNSYNDNLVCSTCENWLRLHCMSAGKRWKIYEVYFIASNLVSRTRCYYSRVCY